MKYEVDLIDENHFKFDNLPDRPEKPTSQEISDIITPKPQGVVADTAWTIYSPNERQVGMWQRMIGGVLKQKPVYQKSFFDLDVSITINTTWQAVVDTSSLNAETLVESSFSRGNKTMYTPTQIDIDGANAGKLSIRPADEVYGSTITLTSCTIRYTKTTDTWQTVE